MRLVISDGDAETLEFVQNNPDVLGYAVGALRKQTRASTYKTLNRLANMGLLIRRVDTHSRKALDPVHYTISELGETALGVYKQVNAHIGLPVIGK